MSVITEKIPPQSFEIVRNQLGAILTDEINNQAVLDGNNPDINPKVFLERIVAFSHTDMPAVNVTLARGRFVGPTVKQADGNYTYYIDVYHKAKTKADSSADKSAMLKLHRLIGIVRAILDDPQYKTLAFEPPFVMSKQLEEFTIANTEAPDLETVVMARMLLTVKLPETTALIQPRIIAGMDTQVKIEESEAGYVYVMDNGNSFDPTFDFTFK